MTSSSSATRVGLAVASTCGVGYIPFAPGTFGSAAALPLWWALRVTGSVWAEVAAILLIVVVGAWSARVTERALAVEDPGIIVIDEVAGMLISVCGLPLTWPVALGGFFLFRLFDIVKPFPARRLEHVPNGWGVMADDVMAGIYAWLVLRAILWVNPSWLT